MSVDYFEQHSTCQKEPVVSSGAVLDVTWFHMLCDMVKSGKIKKMGPNGTMVYLVIKAHTNLKSGHTFPSVETIVKQTGVSKSSVYRSLKLLGDEGYIVKNKKGRRNDYKIVETLNLHHTEGDHVQVKFDYIPLNMQKILSEIKQKILAIENPIHIENLQFNIMNVNGNVQMGVTQTPKKAE